MIRSLILCTFLMYTSTVVASVFEVELEIIEFVSTGMPIDISQQMENKFNELGLKGHERIIAIEMSYKSEKAYNARINWKHYKLNRTLVADPHGAYVYRYNQNLFISSTLLPAYVQEKPRLQIGMVGPKDSEFFLSSVTLTISDNNQEGFSFKDCSYRLDSIFGSQSPITLRRFSFGDNDALARNNACFKAKEACSDRRYSKRLETCTKL